MRIVLALLGVLFAMAAHAQQPSLPAKTTPLAGIITTGNTFQVLSAASSRRALTIQNNNASDNCQILIGGPWQAGDTTSTTRTINSTSMTAAKAAIVLTPGSQYGRYFPYVPNDLILVTCATTGDSYYADMQ